MGDQILRNIVEGLDQYIKSTKTPETANNDLLRSTIPSVVLDNIATSQIAGGANTTLDKKVVVSLINVGEESLLKNNLASRQNGPDYEVKFPVVHVNLYLMFAANFEDYQEAIWHLFRVMEYFQGNKEFSLKSGIQTKKGNPSLYDDIEIVLELHTLNFEQLNDLWGSLGGKQIPFVLYRARLLPIQMQQNTGRAGIISEINLSTQNR